MERNFSLYLFWGVTSKIKSKVPKWYFDLWEKRSVTPPFKYIFASKYTFQTWNALFLASSI